MFGTTGPRSRHSSVAIRLVGAATCGFLALATLAPAADRYEPLREYIRAELARQNVASLAVGVARQGRVLWQEGFGWADRERRIPATADTRYSLASITKPMTTTGLMMLVEQGLIDLDRPANDYLGDHKLTARVGRVDRATVRRIATHTSGLPLHHHFFYEDRADRPPPMDETIRRYGNLVAAPGERFQYSNLGYGILEYIIERTTGRDYATFMRDEVFLPLGLKRTSVGMDEGAPDAYAARYGPGGATLPFYDFDHRGASAIFSSASDLLRFGMFHTGKLPDAPAILSRRSIGQMQRAGARIERGVSYGLGWRITENDHGYRVVSHSGGMGGVSTLLTLVPDEGVAIVALANARSPLPELATRQILRHVLPRFDRLETLALPAPSPPRSRPRTARLRGTWTGQVHANGHEVPLTLSVEESGEIFVRIGTERRRPLQGVTLQEGYLTGVTSGNIGQVDADNTPYSLYLVLKLRQDTLNGSVTAVSRPSGRVGNALSHWVELNRQ
jgi:CubicO group peptidase (beta-lactamase class C family)